VTNDDTYHAFLWTEPQGMIDLGTWRPIQSGVCDQRQGWSSARAAVAKDNMDASRGTRETGMVDLGTPRRLRQLGPMP
jgi:hypothetical protein